MRNDLGVLLERVIHRLTTDRTLDGFTEQQIIRIANAACKALQPLGSMIQVSPPVSIFGDVHGQFGDLLRLFAIVGSPPETKVLFLGDYVDRCRNSLEVIVLLFCLKLKYPKRVDLLRGNHECAQMNRAYGFYEECRRVRSTALWNAFRRAFNELPLCAKVGNRILTMHGGIGPEVTAWVALEELKKPRTAKECDEGIALDLMWADPNNDPCTKGFVENVARRASYLFGTDTVEDCVRNLDIDLIVRAHEVTKNGHQMECADKLCTIFSAPNYCGSDGNCASVMRVSGDLKVSFVTLKPRLDVGKLSPDAAAHLEAQSSKFDAKSPNPGWFLNVEAMLYKKSADSKSSGSQAQQSSKVGDKEPKKDGDKVKKKYAT